LETGGGGQQRCKVTYSIQMTFSNPIYSMVTRQFFDVLANQMHSSFAKRCKDLYYSKA